jgi:hypothetical protein
LVPETPSFRVLERSPALNLASAPLATNCRSAVSLVDLAWSLFRGSEPVSGANGLSVGSRAVRRAWMLVMSTPRSVSVLLTAWS